MRKFNLLFTIILWSLAMVTGMAQPKGFKALKDTSSFIKNFNEKSKSINSNQADFVQEKYISVMTNKVITKGKFYFKKTNKMRWDNTEPAGHCIVLNNGKMYIREKGKIKSYDTNSNKLFKNLNDMMLTTASGNMLNSKEYKHLLFENEKYYMVQLIPVSNSYKKYISTIEIQVEKSDYTVSQIKMNEPSGDYTKIEFSNKKINAPIADETFVLKQ